MEHVEGVGAAPELASECDTLDGKLMEFQYVFGKLGLCQHDSLAAG
jgi:hypothetical protein